MPNIGPLEVVVLLVIALLVLGPKRLPEVGRSLGRGMREFKRSISGITGDEDSEDDPFVVVDGDDDKAEKSKEKDSFQ